MDWKKYNTRELRAILGFLPIILWAISYHFTNWQLLKDINFYLLAGFSLLVLYTRYELEGILDDSMRLMEVMVKDMAFYGKTIEKLGDSLKKENSKREQQIKKMKRKN